MDGVGKGKSIDGYRENQSFKGGWTHHGRTRQPIGPKIECVNQNSFWSIVSSKLQPKHSHERPCKTLYGIPINNNPKYSEKLHISKVKFNLYWQTMTINCIHGVSCDCQNSRIIYLRDIHWNCYYYCYTHSNYGIPFQSLDCGEPMTTQ